MLHDLAPLKTKGIDPFFREQVALVARMLEDAAACVMIHVDGLR